MLRIYICCMKTKSLPLKAKFFALKAKSLALELKVKSLLTSLPDRPRIQQVGTSTNTCFTFTVSGSLQDSQVGSSTHNNKAWLGGGRTGAHWPPQQKIDFLPEINCFGEFRAVFGRPFVRWGPSSPKRGTAPNFWPMSVVAKRLDGLTCHLVWR